MVTQNNRAAIDKKTQCDNSRRCERAGRQAKHDMMLMKEKTEKHKYFALIRRIVLAILGILLGVNVYLVSARSLAGNKLPMPFGFGVAVVLSGSMEPALSVNDIVIVRESESYSINDIVVYDSGREMIVHRIKEQNGDTLTTKGDANNASDEPISAEAVRGRVVFSIPYAGVAVKALRSPVGIIVIILTAILLTKGSFQRKKESDENRIEEIKEEIRRLKAEQDHQSE